MSASLSDILGVRDVLLGAAEKLACQSVTAVAAGNVIVMYAMLVDQLTLADLAQNPTANVTGIVELSNSIANLQNSLRLLTPRGV